MILLVVLLAIYVTLYYIKADEYDKLKKDTENKKAENKWFREKNCYMREREDISHKIQDFDFLTFSLGLLSSLYLLSLHLYN